MTDKKFTVEEGIEIQNEQLSQWKSILKPEVYDALEEFVKRNNHLAKDGFDICRGHSLDGFINNYMLGHRF